ncbi:MAG: tryptophan synthase subunit alpha [Chloroflexi bacterium]|nr:tryptophan synthase subunit alpha [Chloroflexota bacterium]
MNRIARTFATLRAANRAALIPYVTLGYPDFASALELVPAALEAGADMVELGVPFSDPLADGATIQAASQRALANGMTLRQGLEQVAELRARRVTAPLILMGYYNPILQMGLETFAQAAAQAGVDGVIVPDLPLEEAGPLRKALAAHELALIPLIAPTTPQSRVRRIAEHAQGFLYLVSLTGVTGARAELPPDLAAFVQRVRAVTDLPLAVGFGISRPEHAAAVARLADGVIVGSALLRAVGASPHPAQAARAFLHSLRVAMDAARATPSAPASENSRDTHAPS